MKEKAKKILKRSSLFIIVLFITTIFFYNLGSPHREINGYICAEEDKKVWSMYNGVRAEEFGITDEEMINITYAYIYDYSIWTTGGIEDKFIEIPVKRCCYQTKDNYLYCREEYKQKEDK